MTLYVQECAESPPSVDPIHREWSLRQWLQVLILGGEDMGSNPAGKLFTPQKLSIHIPIPLPKASNFNFSEVKKS